MAVSLGCCSGLWQAPELLAAARARARGVVDGPSGLGFGTCFNGVDTGFHLSSCLKGLLAGASGKLNPTVQAAVTLKEYGKTYDDLGLSSLTNALSEQTRASSNGDLQRAEAMLTTQAHTLDAIFNNLARIAIRAEHTDHFDRYLKFALRAQSQCRSTWETLATIQHPPVMGYVQQANIANGPQQVNNASTVPNSAPRVGENPTLQNKLLEEKDGERLDPGAACTPGRADPEMATVGAIDRA